MKTTLPTTISNLEATRKKKFRRQQPTGPAPKTGWGSTAMNGRSRASTCRPAMVSRSSGCKASRTTILATTRYASFAQRGGQAVHAGVNR